MEAQAWEAWEERQYVEDEQATHVHRDLNHAHKYRMEMQVDDEVQPVVVAEWNPPILAAVRVKQANHCLNHRHLLLRNVVQP